MNQEHVQCSKWIYREAHDGGSSNCTRRGVIQRDGKWYCRQHDPVAVKASANKRDAAWRTKWDAQDQAAKERAHKLATWEALWDACRATVELSAEREYADQDEEFHALIVQVATALEAAEQEQP